MLHFRYIAPFNREGKPISTGLHDSHDTAGTTGLAAIVPCYNPGNRVRPVIEGLLRALPRVIVVDDGSTDGGVEALGDLPVRIVTLSPNRGKGFALLAGYRAALENPDISCVASLDADGQHDPAELPRLYEIFRKESADFLIGSRDFTGGHVPFRSRFGNTMTITVMGWLLGRRLPDTQSGYRLLSRRFLEDALNEIEGGRYETEMELLARAIQRGYTIASPTIQTIYEEGNASSHFQKVRDSWRIYKTLIRAAWRMRAKRYAALPLDDR